MAWVCLREPAAGTTMCESGGNAAEDARILKEIRDNSEAMRNLEYLSDNIGARLTASPQLKRANEWTAEMFRRYGLSNVHLEPWTVAHSWTRRAAHARILEPAEHLLTIAAAGWSRSTPGIVRGPLVYFNAHSKEEFPRFEGKLKGAVVIRTEPGSLSPPPPLDPDAVILGPMQRPLLGPEKPPLRDTRVINWQRNAEQMEFFKKEGVAAVLVDSDKPYGLLNMGILVAGYDISLVPAAYVTGEGYRMLFRMLKKGPVVVEIEIANTISDNAVQAYNTVAEIPGSEKPDEIVMLGAHLDSWDLGTGSTDDGTGSVAVLEAARALAKLSLRPVRTIRFVLFTGEEQGHYGSLAYVEAHKNELANISAILVNDSGTGRVLTIGLQDNYQDREIVDQVIAPLHELRLLEPSMRRLFGSDHLSFDQAGVPGFWTIQEQAEYPLTIHSQADTFDKAWGDDLNQGAEVMAAWAYNTAQLPEKLPRK
jgi:hypothetical protein